VAQNSVYYKMSAWHKRLMKDIADLQSAGFEVLPDEGPDLKFDCFRVVLKGPPGMYASGTWHVRFTVASTFPFTSPSVGFVQHILHPNVDWASGSVCLDALNSKWSPVFTLKHIMETLLPYLLAYPNSEDPLNREAAALMRDNPEQYAAKVIDAVKRYSLSAT